MRSDHSSSPGHRPEASRQRQVRSAMTDVKRVGVLGGGLMGSGIAQVAATAGYDTVVRDVSQQVWDKARAGIEKSLAKFVEKGKLPAANRDAALKRLRFTATTADLKECDIVLEAVTEDLDLKNALWKELDALCPPATIFASNTSSLTIAAMAAATRRADRFVGLHFFNPVPLMSLVEVVRTVTTSAETFERSFAFAKSLGKEPVAAKDNSGFIVNLLLVPYLLDAIRAVERGVGSVPDIDKAMQLGCGYPMGPLTLLDFVGLDTTYKIAEIMFTEYREQRYAPPPLLKRMVLAGMNGRKSGKGFYDYSVDPPKVLPLGAGRRLFQPLPPRDPHAWLRLAPLSRGGERPARRTAIRDGALRPRRLDHEARFAQIGGGVDPVGRSDRRLGSRARRPPGRRRDRAWRSDSRADGDARDAGAHHHGDLHGGARVEVV